MKYALVTGASSGIGLALAKRLLEEDYRVYGISRTPSVLNHEEHFTQILMDLTDTEALTALCQRLLVVEKLPFELLVNNAGCGYYGPHETIAPKDLSGMVSVNLTVPLILTGQFIRTLRQTRGCLVNLSSYTAGGVNPHGAAYGATKAALSSFSESVFEENRKQGVRVILAEPEMTATNLYRNADFGPGSEEGSYLTSEEVADLIVSALHTKAGYQRLTIEPQYRRIERKNHVQ